MDRTICFDRHVFQKDILEIGNRYFVEIAWMIKLLRLWRKLGKWSTSLFAFFTSARNRIYEASPISERKRLPDWNENAPLTNTWESSYREWMPECWSLRCALLKYGSRILWNHPKRIIIQTAILIRSVGSSDLLVPQSGPCPSLCCLLSFVLLVFTAQLYSVCTAVRPAAAAPSKRRKDQNNKTLIFLGKLTDESPHTILKNGTRL